MKIKQKDLDKLNSYFEQWRGSDVYFGQYIYTEDRLIIVFERLENSRERIGISFLQCRYISGPTRWSDGNFECRLHELPEGEIGFETRDAGGGFVLRCAGPIVVGESEFIIPLD